MVLAAFMALNAAQAAAPNTVGYTESFEAYTNGFQVSGTNGWGALNSVAGTVSTNAAVIAGLVTYTNNGGAYPLPGASHSNVLQVTDEVTNSIISATGGVVVVDFMVMPSIPEWWPTGSTNWHYAFCLTNNPATNLVVWHRYHGATTNNEWRTLTNGPSLTNGVWTRFTVVQDYASSMFQLRVNNGSWITDPAGWSRSGTGTPTPGGSWFHMVKTNSVMSNFRIGETATNYLDDVVLTNRQVAWSGTGFTEGVTNNGTFTGTLTLGLLYDTFNGSSGDDFVASNKLQVANLPSNLTAVASYTSPTQLTVRLTGAAQQHEAANSTNLVFTLQDTAFTLGNAADVVLFSNAVGLAFSNTPALGYSRTSFMEGSALNDGTIDNSSPMLITLTNALFAGTVGDDFVPQGKVQVVNLPSNLVAVLTLDSQTQLSVSLTNKATLHAAANSLSNLTFTFLDSAFSNAPAYSVAGVSRTNLSLTFLDPVAAPELRYDATSFTEVAANNGSVTGTTLRLTGKAFAGTNTEDFVASGKANATNVPDGLALQLIRDGDYDMTLSFAGHATDHATGGSVSNLAVTFTDDAFTGGNAASVSNAVVTNLVVQFHAQPSLSWDATIFTEAAANDGSLATTNTVTLTDPNSVATFVGGTYEAGTHFTTSGVPAGLSCVVWNEDATHVKVALAGQAAAHATNDNTGFTLQFQSAAFNTVAASNITGSTASLSITYSNQPSLSWDATAFAEAAANDGSIATTNTVTLSGGATFTGGNYTLGNQFTTSGVPAGLSCVVWNEDATHVKVALSGDAAAHAAANSTNFTLQFQSAAFNTVAASNIAGSTASLSVTYSDQPSLSWDNMTFMEAVANDGSIATTNTATLSGGATFTSGTYTLGNQFTTSGVPAGLSCTVWYQDATRVKVALSGNAVAHTSANSTNFTLQFNNAAFNTVAATNITGSATNLAVQFAEPATLTYNGGDTFTEASQGTINSSSITITLDRDTFTGAPGDNLVASNKVTVTHLPVGLTAVITRSSDTQLSVQLTGRAFYNDQADSVTNLTFQFLDTAFSNVAASRVVNALKSDLKINFVNDTPFSYAVPYAEPFEGYAHGAWMTQVTNGWLAEYAGAGEVANTNTVGSWAHAYQGPVPVTATHTNELYVQSDIRSEIRSLPGQKVYLDFSVWPTPMVDAPQVSAAMQLAFYVSTNCEFVIWHQNRTGGMTNNELRVLSNAPVIDTNRWLRVTVCQDYANSLFQVRLNNGEPITDAHGWTGPGGTANGSWFHMVQTNDYMSRFRVAGVGSGYIDDLTVRTNLVNQTPVELTLSPAEFSEAGDSGYIDNSNSNRISLTGAVGATFAGNDGEVYSAGCVAASNLPSNLSVVLTRTSPTNAAIFLTGKAVNDCVRDNVSNLVVSVLDGAFEIGAANIAGAANIVGTRQDGLKILFYEGVGAVYMLR